MVLFVGSAGLDLLERRPGRRVCSQRRAQTPEDGEAKIDFSKDPNMSEDELFQERQRQNLAGYRKKVEERLKGASRVEEVEVDTGNDSVGIPDNLDELDDIVMNRGPKDQGKVAMWGAWLDEDVAGRKVGKVTSNQAEADRLFKAGLALFQRGRYREATKDLTAAILIAGIGSREGGQYQLWLGQAWDAAGEKQKAIAALQSCRGHRDPDVRKVAEEVLYIITAPKLNLGEDNFIHIKTDDQFDPTKRANGRRRSSVPSAVIPKGPEKYSLDWFLEKKPVQPMESNNTDKVTIIGIVIITVALAVASQIQL